METGTWKVKSGLAQMLKGGVIMDVVTPEHAKLAQAAGACAVMALERVPSDIRAAGGVARMADPTVIEAIMKVVTIPVMAKCRIGHFVEAQVLQALGVDYIDESAVLTPADEAHHVWKHDFKVPFVCGCRDLGEALRRIGEGAAMIRTKGEAGTGDIVEAVRHMRAVMDAIRRTEQTIMVTGQFSYDNGFGDMHREEICMYWLTGIPNRTSDQGGANEFFPCEDFPVRLSNVLKSNQEMQANKQE